MVSWEVACGLFRQVEGRAVLVVCCVGELLVSGGDGTTVVHSYPRSTLFVGVRTVCHFSQEGILGVRGLYSVVFRRSHVNDSPRLSVLYLYGVVNFTKCGAFLFQVSLLRVEVVICYYFLHVHHVSTTGTSQGYRGRRRRFYYYLGVLFEASSRATRAFRRRVSGFRARGLIRGFGTGLSSRVQGVAKGTFVRTRRRGLVSPRISKRSVVRGHVSRGHGGNQGGNGSRSRDRNYGLPIGRILFKGVASDGTGRDSGGAVGHLSIGGSSVGSVVQGTSRNAARQSSRVYGRGYPSKVTP